MLDCPSAPYFIAKSFGMMIAVYELPKSQVLPMLAAIVIRNEKKSLPKRIIKMAFRYWQKNGKKYGSVEFFF